MSIDFILPTREWINTLQMFRRHTRIEPERNASISIFFENGRVTLADDDLSLSINGEGEGTAAARISSVAVLYWITTASELTTDTVRVWIEGKRLHIGNGTVIPKWLSGVPGIVNDEASASQVSETDPQEATRRKLAGALSELFLCERELAELHAHIRHYEAHVERTVRGPLASLELLEAQLLQALAFFDGSDDEVEVATARVQALRKAAPLSETRHAAVDLEGLPAHQGLYEQALHRIHPLLASTPKEKPSFHMLLNAVNEAYITGNVAFLESIVRSYPIRSDLPYSRAAEAGQDGMLRAISDAEERILEIDSEIARLQGSEVYEERSHSPQLGYEYYPETGTTLQIRTRTICAQLQGLIDAIAVAKDISTRAPDAPLFDRFDRDEQVCIANLIDMVTTKVLPSPQLKPRDVRDVAALLLALQRLPLNTPGCTVSLTLSIRSGKYQELSYYALDIEDGYFALGTGGTVYSPDVGSDSFSNTWFEVSIDGYRRGEAPGINQWLDGASILLSDGGEITLEASVDIDEAIWQSEPGIDHRASPDEYRTW